MNFVETDDNPLAALAAADHPLGGAEPVPMASSGSCPSRPDAAESLSLPVPARQHNEQSVLELNFRRCFPERVPMETGDVFSVYPLGSPPLIVCCLVGCRWAVSPPGVGERETG